ncbi:MAG: carboxypeptidase-like regulatory domain-containing protein [Candidatus Acidiferrales bacterium]
MKALLVLCFVAVIASSIAPAIARERLGTLEGTVFGPKGGPVEGARVTIQEAGEGDHPHATLTNSDGRFFFPRLLPGDYDLRAYYKGEWSAWERGIVVRVRKGTNVTLKVSANPVK